MPIHVLDTLIVIASILPNLKIVSVDAVFGYMDAVSVILFVSIY